MTMRALVVDDEEDVRRLLGLMLSRLGCEIREAADGQEALAILHEPCPMDVILLDWRMPVLDGPGFLKTVQKESSLKSIPVMMLTGLNEMKDVANALQLGAKEYLMKPITQRTLREKLEVLGFDF
ncbi:MAG: response regulator [Elusimicrobia bacterium]|nr:response regulator [Elusimicrobiota bacterium]